MHLKKIGKNFLCRRLERQIRQLRQKNDFTVVAVAGSVGKTSTKLAIAKTLGASRRVRWQDGNYNDRLTVPLIFFGQQKPSLYNPLAWRKILRENRRQLKKRYPYDVVVVELGTDAPGQLKKFAYLEPDLTVLTAITDEHMAQFKTMKTVAQEELTPLSFSKRSLLNADDIPAKYMPGAEHTSYGLLNEADYRVATRQERGLQGQKITFQLADDKQISAEVAALGSQGAKIALAAVATADMLGISAAGIQKGLRAITPTAGRMQILAGKQGSIIIDDTCNAHPIAVKAVLDVLYATEAKQRIAILGSMNGLGNDSVRLHNEIGGYCNPEKLDLVVTIGRDAAENLAPVAKNQGCKVQTFLNPYEAGEYVRHQLAPETVVLAKGSEDGVFAEEAIKILLANASQSRKLVRQSDYWLKRKKAQFTVNS
ncbi:MAG TPA: Mur ligase family protein [Candidatus Saccharimonadales bacterium]|nr:Mur ligase family protein [Candidatus Saccharimonadales bacterium]